MDTNSTVVVVIILLVVIVISGFLIFRRKAKVDFDLHGKRFKFEGENSDSRANESRSKRQSNGIFGNLSIGKTRMRVTGGGTIADNKTVGDTELTKEDTPSSSKRRS